LLEAAGIYHRTLPQVIDHFWLLSKVVRYC